MSRACSDSDHLKQPFGLGAGQRRVRLVHDDQLGVDRHGACNLDHLPLRDRQVAHGGIGVDMQVDQRHRRTRARLQLAPTDNAQPLRHAPHKHVLDHRQRRHHREFLVNDGDPGVHGLDRPLEIHVLAIKDDAALIAVDDAAQHLDQRRLAGAIFPHQCMHFTPAHVKIDLCPAPARRQSALKRLPPVKFRHLSGP